MHQPDYRLHGVYVRPWTWLHAIKDYSDMAAHLETVPGARAVVNFSPVLIEALPDYARRIAARLATGQPIGDAILDALAWEIPPESPQPESHRSGPALASLLRSLLRVNEGRMKNRFPAYARLHGIATGVLAQDGVMARQDLDDLLTWYVLLWLGESLRNNPLPAALTAKASGFTRDERRALLAWLAEEIGLLLPRYRALADSGRIELSVTPFAHPILPLLLDLGSAREAWPEAVVPEGPYPGGEERCAWHLAEARRVFRQAFGREPAGCWPAEGAISDGTVSLLSRQGFRWTASGARVLFNSLGSAGGLPHTRVWTSAGVGCFFRDDGLSDLIGFEYSKWLASDAVDDFIRHLERVRAAVDEPGQAVLSIIMDGENAWEYFDRNGWEFLQALYRQLVAHPGFRLTTFADVLEQIEARSPPQNAPRALPRIVAGSWVHGTLSTWIGEPAKNRAWELLIHARQAVDAAVLAGKVPADRADAVLRQLAVCEASDWSWWLGADNRLEDGPAFDELYRQQLAALYELLGRASPEELAGPLNAAPSSAQGSQGRAAHAGAPPAAAGGAMRPASPESGP